MVLSIAFDPFLQLLVAYPGAIESSSSLEVQAAQSEYYRDGSETVLPSEGTTLSLPSHASWMLNRARYSRCYRWKHLWWYSSYPKL